MKKIVITFCILLAISSCSKPAENYTYIQSLERPSLLNGTDVTTNYEYNPTLSSYSLNNDFSNIINYCDIDDLSDDAKRKLINNNFVLIENDFDRNYFELYTSNSSIGVKIPSFITTDSLLNAFHMYYEYIQKKTENEFLLDRILRLSSALLSESQNQLSILKGSDYESAAQRNVDYFSVAVALCGSEGYEHNDRVLKELELIDKASSLYVSPIFSTEDYEYKEDYTQYVVRGYYSDSESLEKYFKVMTWYGRMAFVQTSLDLNKSALLMNLALNSESVYDDFQCIYEITSFFAGEPDDNTYFEYYPIIEFYLGDDITIDNLTNKQEEFNDYIEYIKELPSPEINSLIYPKDKTDDEVIKGFRLFGQRASFDTSLLSNLVYPNLEGESNGETRNLPDALDVPASLGSDLALDILQETTNVNDYEGYSKHIDENRQIVEEKGDSPYTASVSSAWLGLLTTLLEEKSEGYPTFMTSEAWGKKNLNTFLGSYTELKHDLILYITGLSNGGGAGGEEIVKDDRGYVEPEPNLYRRLGSIVSAMVTGLDSYQLISLEDIELGNTIINECSILETISIKELNGELPTDEEFDEIRNYGTFIYYIWKKWASLNKQCEGYSDYNYVCYEDEFIYPNFLTADVAVDTESGISFQLSEGRPMIIYTAVYFDGQIRIARGLTYSFYQTYIDSAYKMNDQTWKQIVYSNDRTLLPKLPDFIKDIYVQNDNYITSNKKRLEVTADAIRLRLGPSTSNEQQMHYSGEHLKAVKKGEIYYYTDTYKDEKYTWYHICSNDDIYGQIYEIGWIADENGEWITVIN